MPKENAKSDALTSNVPSMSKDEVIGYHKGSINTLLAERNELLKMAAVTENLINAHAAELQKLGINIMQPPQANVEPAKDSKQKKA